MSKWELHVFKSLVVMDVPLISDRNSNNPIESHLSYFLMQPTFSARSLYILSDIFLKQKETKAPCIFKWHICRPSVLWPGKWWHRNIFISIRSSRHCISLFNLVCFLWRWGIYKHMTTTWACWLNLKPAIKTVLMKDVTTKLVCNGGDNHVVQLKVIQANGTFDIVHFVPYMLLQRIRNTSEAFLVLLGFVCSLMLWNISFFVINPSEICKWQFEPAVKRTENQNDSLDYCNQHEKCQQGSWYWRCIMIEGCVSVYMGQNVLWHLVYRVEKARKEEIHLDVCFQIAQKVTSKFEGDMRVDSVS